MAKELEVYTFPNYKPKHAITIEGTRYYFIPFGDLGITDYAISKDGKLISRRIKCTNDDLWHRIYPCYDKNTRYLIATLCTDFRRPNNSVIQKSFSLQKLLYCTFVTGCNLPCDIVVDHINNIRVDNRLDNLQLLSRVENWHKRLFSIKPRQARIFKKMRDEGKTASETKSVANLSDDQYTKLLEGAVFSDITGRPVKPKWQRFYIARHKKHLSLIKKTQKPV